MNYLIYSVLLFFTILNTATSQNLSHFEKDSIYKLIDSAHVLHEQSKISESLVIGNEILDYATKISNDSILIDTYILLGTNFFKLGDTEKAINYLLTSRNIATKNNYTARALVASNNIGVINRESGDLEASFIAFKKAYQIAETLADSTEIVYPAYNIGNHLVSVEEDYVNAKVYFKRALSVVESIPEYSEYTIVGELYEALGRTYYKLGDYKLSEAYYNKSINFATKHGHLEVLSFVYSSKALVFKESQRYEEAYNMLEEYIIISDSIEKIENFEAVKEIEAKYLIKEKDEKLKYIEDKNSIQASGLKKSKLYNFFLGLLSLILIIAAYWIYNKNKELKQARDQAENLSRVKSNFYSEISHELRTPLYAVIELSNLLLKEKVSVTHKEYLESLKFSGNHLLSLINNVLELNKIESGKIKVLTLDFDLKNLITNVIDSLEFALLDSKNSIKLKYDDDIPKLLVGDSLKLAQILINLISNAIKFTNDGYIEVIIKQINAIGDNVNIYFEVSDNGMGISVEKQKQIFEDFYQENLKNENSYRGTGLGLSIVKRILEVMGSEIKVNSIEGEGTTFSFELTFSASGKLIESSALYQTQLNALKNKRILIVDDNKINQLVTGKVLDQLNIQSKAVDSGKKAIAILKEEYFDCVLMDLHMPEMDGYETTKYIREFNKTIAIVALTAASTDEVESKIKNSKLDDYILKPFITTDFVDTLKKAIDNK